MVVPGSTRTLARAECLDLLAGGGLGRVAATVAAVPVVYPVAFGLLGEDVVFRTSPGSRLQRAVENAVVAFEADDVDGSCRTGWVVQVVGMARPVSGPAVLATPHLRLSTGSGSDRLVVICDAVFSGHRLLPAEPSPASG